MSLKEIFKAQRHNIRDYGMYIALTDGVSKAYIAKQVATANSGTAYGLYQMIIGLGAFVASALAGGLWYYFSPGAPFIFGGVCAIFAACLLAWKKERP